LSSKAALFLLFLLTITLGILRSDLSCAAAGKPQVHLSFWNGWTGPDGKVALDIIRRFHQENPDVDVTMQRIDWATYYNKLMVAAFDDRGPEVFIIHASTLPRMNQAGFLAPVDDMYERGDVSESDFEPYVLGQVTFGKNRIAVPLDIHPQGLYCNEDLLKKIGMVDAQGHAQPPRNKEEFLKAVKAMKVDTDKDGKPDDWGFVLSLWRNNFMSLLPQFGGRYFDDNGRADLACEGNIKALEFLGSLEKDNLIPPPENGLGWSGFRQGKVGMIWEGVYMLGDLLTLKDFHYIGAPIPQIGPKPGTMADSHCLCIHKGLDPAKREAAERFIKYLSVHSIEWAAAGQVPARKSVRDTPEFRAMPVQYAFSKQVPNAVYPPRTTVLFEMSTELDLAVEKVIRGRASAKDALTVANDHLQAILDRDKKERAVAK